MRLSKLFVPFSVLALAGAITVVPAELASAIPPDSNVAVPASGATVSGTRVVLDADDLYPGTTQVDFEVAGGSLSNDVIATANSPALWGWATTWNSTSVPNGTYTLSAVPVPLPPVTHPGSISITVNNPPPTATIVLPANNAGVSGNQWIDAIPSPGVTSVGLYVIPSQVSGATPSSIGNAAPSLVGWVLDWNTTSVVFWPYGYTLFADPCYSWGTPTNGGCVTLSAAISDGIHVTVVE